MNFASGSRKSQADALRSIPFTIALGMYSRGFIFYSFHFFQLGKDLIYFVFFFEAHFFVSLHPMKTSRTSNGQKLKYKIDGKTAIVKVLVKSKGKRDKSMSVTLPKPL